MARGQPVRVELHGSLHLLGEEEIPHYSGHPPPCGSGGKTTPERGVRGVNFYPSPYACTQIAARVEEKMGEEM